jgi:hypothetical protein
VPRQGEAARQFGRGQAPRQLQQGQRITVRFGHDQVADLGVQRPGQHRVQQGPGVVLAQPGDGQLGQPGQLVLPVPGQFAVQRANREHQADTVGDQAPGGEPQRLGRRLVEPLLVVDHADERPARRDLGHQAEHGQPDQETIRGRSRGQAEGHPQRVPLRRGQVAGVIQHGRAQLMQAGEGQLHLGLDARRPRHPAAAGLPDQVAQQRAFAHAGRAAHHQGPALPAPHRVDEPVKRVPLGAPVGQLQPQSHTAMLAPHEIVGYWQGAFAGGWEP